jgi:arsenate reductase
MEKQRILYVCTGQGARARIAEFYTSQLTLGLLHSESASFEPGLISGLPNIIMQEEQYPTPLQGAVSIFERFADNEHYDYVITLCDDQGNEQCPLFRNCVQKLYGSTATIESWCIPDFRTLNGNSETQLQKAIEIRELIKQKVGIFSHHITHPLHPIDTGIHCSG